MIKEYQLENDMAHRARIASRKLWLLSNMSLVRRFDEHAELYGSASVSEQYWRLVLGTCVPCSIIWWWFPSNHKLNFYPSLMSQESESFKMQVSEFQNSNIVKGAANQVSKESWAPGMMAPWRKQKHSDLSWAMPYHNHMLHSYILINVKCKPTSVTLVHLSALKPHVASGYVRPSISEQVHLWPVVVYGCVLLPRTFDTLHNTDYRSWVT